MSKSDRLYALMQILRDGRLHRAEELARRLDVAQRTVYRDMDTLAKSGLPIAGTRGLGYTLTAAVSLPPLNLTMTELEALHLGMAVVGQAGDEELQAAAKSLSAKIDAALPEDRDARPTGWGFAVYPFADAAEGFRHMPSLRNAIRARQKIRLTHDGQPRTLRPLKLDYWGRVWTITGWCETTRGFANLRVDKISTLTILPVLFLDEPGKTLADYLEEKAP